MATKLKLMREKVRQELQHIPKGPLPQGELRMTYWARRMHSLGMKSVDKTRKQVLSECISQVAGEYPDHKFVYDEEFFR